MRNGNEITEKRLLYQLLKRYNCHEKIRPYLHNFPFEIDNIKLTIGFDDADGILGDGHIAQIGKVKNNRLYYSAYNAEAEKFYSLHRESYEEARRIVMGYCGMDTP